MPHSISFEEAGSAVIAKIEGRIHGTYVNEIETVLMHSTKDFQYVILDLEKLEFVSSSGLRTFLKLRRVALDNGGAVALCNPQESVRKVLEVASFEHLFPITDSVDGALELWGINKNS